MTNVLKGCIVMLFLCTIIGACSCSKTSGNLPVSSDTTNNDQPALMGRLIFHSYSCYDCNDSKLYSYDFSINQLKLLSGNWHISNAMNAHFSPDGHTIVFMGKPAGVDNWDVFSWNTGSAAEPGNLTAAFGNTRDEDPKFSTDGSRIVFKQNGIMKEMDTLGNIQRTFSVPQREGSMPYYAKGDSVILYSGSEASGNTADIYRLSVATNTVQPVSALPGVEEYYPIAKDDTSFLFTRWFSAGNHNDQVYVGFLNGSATQRLPFNETDQNYSDAYPVDSRYVIISSTRPGGKGSYDLYVADIVTGKKWSLSLYHPAINTAGNELGACYLER